MSLEENELPKNNRGFLRRLPNPFQFLGNRTRVGALQSLPPAGPTGQSNSDEIITDPKVGLLRDCIVQRVISWNAEEGQAVIDEDQLRQAIRTRRASIPKQTQLHPRVKRILQGYDLLQEAQEAVQEAKAILSATSLVPIPVHALNQASMLISEDNIAIDEETENVLAVLDEGNFIEYAGIPKTDAERRLNIAFRLGRKPFKKFMADWAGVMDDSPVQLTDEQLLKIGLLEVVSHEFAHGVSEALRIDALSIAARFLPHYKGLFSASELMGIHDELFARGLAKVVPQQYLLETVNLPQPVIDTYWQTREARNLQRAKAADYLLKLAPTFDYKPGYILYFSEIMQELVTRKMEMPGVFPDFKYIFSYNASPYSPDQLNELLAVN